MNAKKAKRLRREFRAAAGQLENKTMFIPKKRYYLPKDHPDFEKACKEQGTSRPTVTVGQHINPTKAAYRRYKKEATRKGVGKEAL